MATLHGDCIGVVGANIFSTEQLVVGSGGTASDTMSVDTLTGSASSSDVTLTATGPDSHNATYVTTKATNYYVPNSGSPVPSIIRTDYAFVAGTGENVRVRVYNYYAYQANNNVDPFYDSGECNISGSPSYS